MARGGECPRPSRRSGSLRKRRGRRSIPISRLTAGSCSMRRGRERARDLYLLRVGGGRAINLTAGSRSDDVQGAFSPDGERIAFRSERDGGGLFVMGATGESVRRLTSLGRGPALVARRHAARLRHRAVDDPYSRAVRSRSSGSWTWCRATRRSCGWRRRAAGVVAGRETNRVLGEHGGQRDIWTIAASGGTPVPVTHGRGHRLGARVVAGRRRLYFVSDRGGSPNLWRVPVDESAGTADGAPEMVTNGVRAHRQRALLARRLADGARRARSVVRADLADFDPAQPGCAGAEGLRSTAHRSAGARRRTMRRGSRAPAARAGGHRAPARGRQRDAPPHRRSVKDRIPILVA